MNLARIVLLISIVTQTGCTGYSLNVLAYRSQMESGNYTGAGKDLGEASRDPDRLLYLMESGLLAHYNGEYERSNALFARAERAADRLFTRSAAREVGALLTNDETRPYRGEAFERVLIHYYRALNYWYTGRTEDALVECRKANLKLASRAAEAEALEFSDLAHDPSTYQNDAFIHYITGLFYEAGGEWNDAGVSYRNARTAYGFYDSVLGIPTPAILTDDLDRLDDILDGRPVSGEAALHPTDTGGELILFAEVGFVPRKIQRDVNLPLSDREVKIVGAGGRASTARAVAERWHTPEGKRSRRHTAHADYWLRVAIPELRSATGDTRSVRISSGSYQSRAVVAEDIGALARKTFEGNLPAIRARTVARALTKFTATQGIKKKNRVLGFLANLFTASVEAADTRSWVSLPDQIHIGRLRLPAGVHTLVIESVNTSGNSVSRQILEHVDITPGQRTFRNVRIYN